MQTVKFTLEIPQELHTKLKTRSAMERISIKDLIIPALEKLVKWPNAQIPNAARCMWEIIQDVLTVLLQYQEKKRGLKFETGIKKTRMDFIVFSWKY